MVIQSKKRKANNVTIAIHGETKEGEQIIKKEIQKAVKRANRLLDKKVSYEMFLKF